MGRVVEVGDPFVQPVHRQRVLDQIVGADAEEFYAPRERIGGQHRRRDFNHGADFQAVVEGDIPGAQFLLAFLDQRVGLGQLVEAGNHGIHHLDVALDRRAQNRAQLVPKNLPFLETKPDGAPAQKGIEFLRHRQVREELVAAQVQRADDDRVGLQSRRHLAIHLILFLLGRQDLAIEVEIFRPEKAHALGSASPHVLGVGGLFDVG